MSYTAYDNARPDALAELGECPRRRRSHPSGARRKARLPRRPRRSSPRAGQLRSIRPPAGSTVRHLLRGVDEEVARRASRLRLAGDDYGAQWAIVRYLRLKRRADRS